jgi:hypothetical protein
VRGDESTVTGRPDRCGEESFRFQRRSDRGGRDDVRDLRVRRGEPQDVRHPASRPRRAAGCASRLPLRSPASPSWPVAHPRRQRRHGRAPRARVAEGPVRYGGGDPPPDRHGGGRGGDRGGRARPHPLGVRVRRHGRQGGHGATPGHGCDPGRGDGRPGTRDDRQGRLLTDPDLRGRYRQHHRHLVREGPVA